MKRWIALLLAALMLAGALPVNALAAVVNRPSGGQFVPVNPDRPFQPVQPEDEPIEPVTPGANNGEHKYTWSMLQPSTCMQEGVEQGVCRDCGQTVTRSKARGNHTYGAWGITYQPEDGIGMVERERTCQLCGYVAKESVYPEEALYRGIKNRTDDIWEMQKALIDQGYLSGEPDGAFGPNTEKGVKRFQKTAGFKEDGVAWGPVLSALLGRDVSELEEVLLEIVDVTEPMLSEPPVNAAKVLNEGYKVDEVEWFYKGEKMWQRDAFMIGEAYTIQIVLDKESTRRVAYSATVNGYPATVEPYEGKQLLVTCEMICGGPDAGMSKQSGWPDLLLPIDQVGAYAIEMPVVGEKPSYRGFANGVEYKLYGGTGDPNNEQAITWRDLTADEVVTSGVFKPDHEYSVQIKLTPRDGYAFVSPVSQITATVNDGAAAVISSDEETITIERNFGKPISLNTIQEIAVIGVQEPIAGQTPSYEAVIANGSEYVRMDGSSTGTVNGMTWYAGNSGIPMNDDMTFEAGKKYRLEIVLEPKGGSAFAPVDEMTATVNGKEAAVSVPMFAANAHRRKVSVSYTAAENGGMIREVAIENVTQPLGMDDVVYNATAVHSTYHLDTKRGLNGVWWKGTSVLMSDGYYDVAFQVTVYVTAEETAMFAADVKATVNGFEAEVTHDSDTELTLTYTFPPVDGDAEALGDLYVTEFTYPRADQNPDYDVIVQNQAGDVIYNKTVTWRDQKTMKRLAPTDKFESGRSYIFTVETEPQPGVMYPEDQKVLLRPINSTTDCRTAVTVLDDGRRLSASAVFNIDGAALYGLAKREEPELEKPKLQPVTPAEPEIPDGADVGAGSVEDMLGENDNYFYYEFVVTPPSETVTYPVFVGTVVDKVTDAEPEEGEPGDDWEWPEFVVIVPPKGEENLEPEPSIPEEKPVEPVKPVVPTVPMEPIPLPEVVTKPEEAKKPTQEKKSEAAKTDDAAGAQEEAGNPLYLIAPDQKVNGIVTRSAYGNAMALYNAQLVGVKDAMGLKLSSDSTANCGNDIVYISDLDDTGVYDAFFKLYDFASKYGETDLFFGPLADLQRYKIFALLQSAPSADPNALCNYTQLDSVETLANYAKTLVYSADRLTATKLNEGENLLTLVVWDRSHAGRWLMIVAQRR